jgi:hypothetical protein
MTRLEVHEIQSWLFVIRMVPLSFLSAVSMSGTPGVIAKTQEKMGLKNLIVTLAED